MEGLKALIRNLAFILLLAAFLEMLLPSNKMKSFVQLVMGLFVIAAVLNPLADLLRLNLENEIPAWFSTQSSDLPVLAGEGEALSGKEAIREQYRKILVNQISVLVKAIEGVKKCEVDVTLEEKMGGFADYPQILGVNIFFSQDNISISPVKPVIIDGIGDSNTPEQELGDSPLAQEIKKQVSAFMQIPEEIIIVREET
ncbi:MAG TPA: stage III sporulation protein AF [Peptococcaceae bacterium]|nr:stage III sporulation protein AF [Peptococcaceae bacterium]